MSVRDLALKLENDRIKYNKAKPINSLSKSVMLIDEYSSKTKIYPILGKCV